MPHVVARADADRWTGLVTRPPVHRSAVLPSADAVTSTALDEVREALAAGERVVLLCRDTTWAAVQQLDPGGGPRPVRLGDSAHFRRPAATLARLRRVADERRVPVRVVQEAPDDGGHRAHHWQQYEAALDLVLADRPCSVLCLYDGGTRDGSPVALAEQAHATTDTGEGPRATHGRRPAADLVREASDAPVPPDGPPTFALVVDDLSGVRRAVRSAVADVVSVDRPADEFLLAVHEVTSNGWRHGRPPVAVALWAEPTRLVCTVTDRGPGVTDPFAGFVPHDRDRAEGGLGLWIARQLCDDLTWEQTDAGFTVRLMSYLPG